MAIIDKATLREKPRTLTGVLAMAELFLGAVVG